VTSTGGRCGRFSEESGTHSRTVSSIHNLLFPCIEITPVLCRDHHEVVAAEIGVWCDFGVNVSYFTGIWFRQVEAGLTPARRAVPFSTFLSLCRITPAVCRDDHDVVAAVGFGVILFTLVLYPIHASPVLRFNGGSGLILLTNPLAFLLAQRLFQF